MKTQTKNITKKIACIFLAVSLVLFFPLNLDKTNKAYADTVPTPKGADIVTMMSSMGVPYVKTFSWAIAPVLDQLLGLKGEDNSVTKEWTESMFKSLMVQASENTTKILDSISGLNSKMNQNELQNIKNMLRSTNSSADDYVIQINATLQEIDSDLKNTLDSKGFLTEDEESHFASRRKAAFLGAIGITNYQSAMEDIDKVTDNLYSAITFSYSFNGTNGNLFDVEKAYLKTVYPWEHQSWDANEAFNKNIFEKFASLCAIDLASLQARIDEVENSDAHAWSDALRARQKLVLNKSREILRLYEDAKVLRYDNLRHFWYNGADIYFSNGNDSRIGKYYIRNERNTGKVDHGRGGIVPGTSEVYGLKGNWDDAECNDWFWKSMYGEFRGLDSSVYNKMLDAYGGTKSIREILKEGDIKNISNNKLLDEDSVICLNMDDSQHPFQLNKSTESHSFCGSHIVTEAWYNPAYQGIKLDTKNSNTGVIDIPTYHYVNEWTKFKYGRLGDTEQWCQDKRYQGTLFNISQFNETPINVQTNTKCEGNISESSICGYVDKNWDSHILTSASTARIENNNLVISDGWNKQTYTPKAHNGYMFLRWECNDSNIKSDATGTYNISNKNNISFSAIFTKHNEIGTSIKVEGESVDNIDDCFELDVPGDFYPRAINAHLDSNLNNLTLTDTNGTNITISANVKNNEPYYFLRWEIDGCKDVSYSQADDVWTAAQNFHGAINGTNKVNIKAVFAKANEVETNVEIVGETIDNIDDYYDVNVPDNFYPSSINSKLNIESLWHTYDCGLVYKNPDGTSSDTLTIKPKNKKELYCFKELKVEGCHCNQAGDNGYISGSVVPHEKIKITVIFAKGYRFSIDYLNRGFSVGVGYSFMLYGTNFKFNVASEDKRTFYINYTDLEGNEKCYTYNLEDVKGIFWKNFKYWEVNNNKLEKPGDNYSISQDNYFVYINAVIPGDPFFPWIRD